MKYHMSLCNGHGTVITNIGQTVSSSASITHLSKRPEDPPWHNEHNRCDIADFGPMSAKIWFNIAQLYLCHSELCCYLAEIGKIVPTYPFKALPVSRALAWLGFLGRIGQSKFERLLMVSGDWTVTAALTRVIFHISIYKYISLIIDTINCLNCTSSHFAARI